MLQEFLVSYQEGESQRVIGTIFHLRICEETLGRLKRILLMCSLWRKSAIDAVKVKVEVTQSCPTLCDPMVYAVWNSPGQNTGVGSLSLLQGHLPNLGIEPRSPAL